VNGFTQARPTWSGAAPPLAGTVEARRRHQAHAAKVQRVARQLRQRPPGRRVSLDKGVVSHQVPKPRDRKYSDDKIDISARPLRPQPRPFRGQRTVRQPLRLDGRLLPEHADTRRGLPPHAGLLLPHDNGVTNVHPKSALGRLLRLAQRFRRFQVADRPDVTVDLFVPFSRLEAFMAWYAGTIGHYPIWVVPYRRVRDYEWIAPAVLDGVDDSLFVDLAIYGMKQPVGRNVYAEMEQQLPAFHAIKTLISYNYYDEATFSTIWNRANYQAVKRLTDPHNAFRDLYDKTCRAARGLDEAAA